MGVLGYAVTTAGSNLPGGTKIPNGEDQSVGGFVNRAVDPIRKKKSAEKRSKEISGEIENAQGNYDEFTNLRDDAIAGIDSSWHNAGQDTAESYARRGLGGSGMDNGDQYQLASKRASAVEDATMKARAAAIANQRADLSQEQTALTGLQTSDINAQRLAMEQQAYYDQILADAVGALANVGVQYGVGAQGGVQDLAANQNDALVRQKWLESLYGGGR